MNLLLIIIGILALSGLAICALAFYRAWRIDREDPLPGDGLDPDQPAPKETHDPDDRTSL